MHTTEIIKQINRYISSKIINLEYNYLITKTAIYTYKCSIYPNFKSYMRGHFLWFT